MTLDEAIKRAEDVANEYKRMCETVHPAMQLSDYGKCAEEHRQLAEWLKDYKRLKEHELYKVSEYDKDHIWYKGNQYISLRRFLEVKTEKNEPCGDAISRQAVLDKKKLVELEDGQSFYCISPEDVETLPSVTLQPKLGEWIVHEKPHGIRYLECPHCNIWYLNEHLIRNSFCPNCGAKMVEPQERSGEK